VEHAELSARPVAAAQVAEKLHVTPVPAGQSVEWAQVVAAAFEQTPVAESVPAAFVEQQTGAVGDPVVTLTVAVTDE
jgi:hypothetical protein